MKLFSKIALLLAILFIAVCFGQAQQMESLVVSDVSTFTVTGSDFIFNANPLAISSSTPMALIKELDISITGMDVVDAAQTITLWDYFVAGSSASTVKIWEVSIDSDTARNGGGTPYQKSFGDRWQLKADHGLAITKSSTGSTVRVSLQYR